MDVIKGRVCLAHAEHACPVPIVLHTVRPRPRGGAGTGTIQLCANAHGLVHSLLDHIEEWAMVSPYATTLEVVRTLPRDLWAKYPGAVRVIAYKGWQTYGLGFLGGRYTMHYRFWRTDGTARGDDVPVFADIIHAARWSRRWRQVLESM